MVKVVSQRKHKHRSSVNQDNKDPHYIKNIRVLYHELRFCIKGGMVQK